MLDIVIGIVVIAAYVISLVTMNLVTYQILKLPRAAQLPVFSLTAILFLSPIWFSIVVALIPLPTIFFICYALFLGDLHEVYNVVSIMGPLNILLPCIVGTVAYLVGPRVLSNKSFKLARKKRGLDAAQKTRSAS